MDSMFLTENELAELTKCHTHWGRAKWLKANKVPHAVREGGSVVVLRKEMESAMKRRTMYDPLPTTVSVLKLKSLPRNPCGVYFLIRNREIVYIGMTKTFFARIAAHLTGEKEFDSVAFIPVAEKDVLGMEGEMIARFNPVYNVMGRRLVAAEETA
ncbi:DUF4224 domain-containing protein [Paraburkholderia sp. BCC1885]|uniref:DUF4224 domain-containing protein n=1 Tax=Paraburkholderia sp. BCC1885 TaxID=2562669 RepID=UPI001181F404|nr:DUF4224 domain-containing protein [Paraburkholderia sp. BCC1885]